MQNETPVMECLTAFAVVLLVGAVLGSYLAMSHR